MDKFAGLASLFDPSVGTGNAALDEMMGVRPYTQAERDEEARQRNEEIQYLLGAGDTSLGRISTTANKNLPVEARALLDTIAGTESPDYNTVYGGRKVRDLSWHPGISVPIGSGLNAGRTSSAAGRYQFLAPTWEAQARKLGLTDFSPESQDIAAWDLADTIYGNKTGRDLLTDLRSGDPNVHSHIGKALSSVWTSLPGGIEQRQNANRFTRQYANAVGMESGEGLDVSQNQASPAARLLPGGQNQSAIPDNLEPVYLSNRQVAYKEKDIPIEDFAAALKQSGVDATPVRPFQLPNAQTAYVDYDMSDDDALAMFQKQAPEMLLKPGETPEDKTGYLPAMKQAMTTSLGQLGVGAGEIAKKLGAEDVGAQMAEWGREKEEAAKGMFTPPTEEQAGAFTRKFGIPLAQDVASILPIVPAMAVSGPVGTALGAGALGTQALGSLEQRAREEGKPFDIEEAAPYAVGETVVNLLPFKYIAPLFKAASSDVVLGSREAIQKIVADKGLDAAKEYVGSRLGNAAKQMGMAEATGAAADVASAVIERAYTDKPLWNENAWDEYKDVLAQGAPLYLTAGAGAGLVGRHVKATEVARIEEQQQAKAAGEEQAKAQEAARLAQEDVLEKRQAARQERREAAGIPPELEGIPYEEARRIVQMEEAKAAAPVEEPLPTPEAPVEEIPEPTVRAKPFYEQLGVKARKGSLVRTNLERLDTGELDINNPAHGPIINEFLDEIERKKMPRDQEAINNLRIHLGEVQKNAQQVPETGPIDGGGSAQLGFRQEGRGATEGGEGMEPSRQGIKTPEVRFSREKAPEEVAPRSAVEMFEPQSIEYIRTPRFKSREKLVEMPIDQFLKLAKHTEEAAFKKEPLEKSIAAGEKLRDLPQLWITEEEGQQTVTGHEGRHRAMALKRLGYTSMPVKITHGAIRWSEQQEPHKSGYREEWPTTLKGENGDIVEFPVKREEAALPYAAETPTTPTPPETQFAREVPQETAALPRDEIVQHAKRITQSWKNAPKIEVRPLDQLPAHIQEAVGTSKVPGVYDNGTVYLVEGNLRAPEHVQETLFHESYGHHGLRQLLGKKLDSHLANIYNKIGGDDGLRKYADKYNFDLGEYERATENEKPYIRNAILTEELLAHIAQEKPSLRGAVRAAYGALRNFLREIGFDRFMDYTDAELSRLMQRSARAIKKGVTAKEQAKGLRFQRQAETEPKEKLTGLAGTLKSKTFGDKMSSTMREFVSEGRHTSFRSEWFDDKADLAKPVKNLPTIVNGKARVDMLASAAAQSGNVIADVIHEGYAVPTGDGSYMVVKNHALAPEKIFRSVEEMGKTEEFNNMLVGLAARTIRAEDNKTKAFADYLETKAAEMDDYAESLGDKNKAKKFQKSAANLRALADNKLKAINYDSRTGVSDEDIALATKMEQENPELAMKAQSVYEQLRSLVDVLQDSGLINAEQARIFKSRPNYFPLYKHIDFDEALANPSAYLTQIVGQMGRSPKSIADIKKQRRHFHEVMVEENVLKHIAFVINAAYQNNIKKALAYQSELCGMATRTTKDKAGDSTIAFKDKGQEHYYDIHDKDAMFALMGARPITNPLIKNFRKVSNIARMTMVMNPLFWFRQVIREPLTASFVGRTGVITPFDTLKEIGKIVAGKSARYEDLKRRGVVAAQDVITDPAEFIKYVQKDKGFLSKGLDHIKKIHEAVDGATRAVVAERAYQDAISKGLSEEDAQNLAAIKAREIINFSKQGRNETIRAIRAVTPFFGAALNGLDVLAKAAAPERIGKLSKAEAMEARRMFYSRAAMIALYSTAYALAMSDDEDYLKSPDRALNWLIPTGEKDTPFIKAPIPYEIGFFVKTLPELLALANMGAITTKKAVSEAGKAVSETIIPPMPMIYAIKPALEAAMNFDFHTWRPIESAAEHGLMTHLKDKRASEVTKEVAKKLHESGIDMEVLSPDRMEHVLNGYFGQLWSITRAASDMVLYDGPEKPEKILADYPIIGGAFSRGTKDTAVSDFYDVYNSVKALTDSEAFARNRSDADMLEEIRKDERYQQYTKASTPLGKIMQSMNEKSKDINRVENMQLTAAQKRQYIDRLTEERNALANKGIAMAKRLGIEM